MKTNWSSLYGALCKGQRSQTRESMNRRYESDPFLSHYSNLIVCTTDMRPGVRVRSTGSAHQEDRTAQRIEQPGWTLVQEPEGFSRTSTAGRPAHASALTYRPTVLVTSGSSRDNSPCWENCSLFLTTHVMPEVTQLQRFAQGPSSSHQDNSAKSW